LGLVALTAAPARADQCQWLEDPAVATRAMRELASHPEVISYCEPCGDAAPGAPYSVASTSIRRVDPSAVTLVVDGQEVDLAYLYVKTGERQYRNLAALAGCPTSDVSPSLRVETATAAGVLIQADRRAEPAMPVMLATPAVEPPAPTVIVVAAAPMSWLDAFLALGAPLLILGSLALWIASRRRALHVPRASRLSPPR
ncbi:MAG: hypothetical protein H7138_01390, partial [Myxococcales bacterium]|nr:hypothetical protein [Myxococcales bacterium]